MYCNKCGEQINDEAIICPKCGCSTGKTVKQSRDSSSIGYTLLGFFIPLIGLILYFVWKEEYPLRSKNAGKGALIGFIVSVVVSILYGAIIGSMFGSIMYYY